MNIIFIFVMYRRSSAVVTPAKYECDSQNLTGTYAWSKSFLTEKSTNGTLSIPTPGRLAIFRWWIMGCLLQVFGGTLDESWRNRTRYCFPHRHASINCQTTNWNTVTKNLSEQSNDHAFHRSFEDADGSHMLVFKPDTHPINDFFTTKNNKIRLLIISKFSQKPRR